MTLYLDTSLLVALLTAEPRKTDVEFWMREQEPEQFAISNWVVTEFSAALSIKLRMGQMTEGDREKSLAAFDRLARESFLLFSLNEHCFLHAARLADRHVSGLRAGDALHLAIASQNGATLCTLDRRLTAAGQEVGVSVILV